MRPLWMAGMVARVGEIADTSSRYDRAKVERFASSSFEIHLQHRSHRYRASRAQECAIRRELLQLTRDRSGSRSDESGDSVGAEAMAARLCVRHESLLAAALTITPPSGAPSWERVRSGGRGGGTDLSHIDPALTVDARKRDLAGARLVLAKRSRVRISVEGTDRFVFRHRAAPPIDKRRIELELGGNGPGGTYDAASEVFGHATGAVAEEPDPLPLELGGLVMQQRSQREIQGTRVHVADLGGEGERDRHLARERRIGFGLVESVEHARMAMCLSRHLAVGHVIDAAAELAVHVPRSAGVFPGRVRAPERVEVARDGVMPIDHRVLAVERAPEVVDFRRIGAAQT